MLHADDNTLCTYRVYKKDGTCDIVNHVNDIVIMYHNIVLCRTCGEYSYSIHISEIDRIVLTCVYSKTEL